MNFRMKPVLFMTFLIVCVIIGYSILRGQPAPIQTNSVFGLTMDRFDYIITDSTQNGFQTTAPLRGSVIIVVRNGLIQTAGAGADYTNVAAPQGRMKVNFVQPLLVGDRVSIIYWR